MVAFVELGRLVRMLNFADLEVSDKEAIATVQGILEGEAGKMERITRLVVRDDDSFIGTAQQRIGLGRLQTYEFEIDTQQGRIRYRLTDADQAAQFVEDSFADVLDFATKSAKSGKKLNCKPGNIQCGGKCQSGKLNCYANMTPAQKKAAQAAAKQAKATGKPAAKAAPTTAPPAPSPAPSVATAGTGVVKTNQTELDRSRADLVQRFGVKTVEAAEKNVQKILNDADVFIRVGSSSTLETILGDRFKTAHELGRDQHNIPYLRDDYLTARARVESKTLGYDASTSPGDRPIYAYMGGSDLNGRAHADVARAYGSIAIKLKPEVKDRTTFTGSDSFKSGIASEVKNDGPPPPPNAASLVATTRHGFDRNSLPRNYPDYYSDDSQDGPALRAAAKAKSIDDLAPKLAPTGNAYIEAQVHGGVKPSDIASIHFTPRGASDRPTPAIAQFAKANGVDLFVNDRKLTPQELDDLANPKVDKRSPRLRNLADALEKGDFDTVFTEAKAIADDADKVSLQQGERDKVLKQLLAESGYDGLPKVAKSDDVDRIWQDGGVLMVRGVTRDPKDPDKYLRDFQSGDLFVGNGIYGNGTYVGHSGKIKQDANGDDTIFVHRDSRTAAKDAVRAFREVAKHGYINSKTLNFRMVLGADAKVVTQTALLRERNQLKSRFDAWAQTARQRVLGSAPIFTTDDVKRFTSERKKVKPDTANATITTVSTRKKNGGRLTEETQQWDVPISTGTSERVEVRKVTTKGVRGITSGSTLYQVRDADGNIVRTAATEQALRKEVADYIAERSALARLGFRSIPEAGKPNADDATRRRLADLDRDIKRTSEVLGLGINEFSNLAVLRGYDAVALDQSYERNTFMNLLNRSVVTIQDTPLDLQRARTKGAA